MDKLVELRAKRAEKVADLDTLNEKMNAEDYAEDERHRKAREHLFKCKH